MKASPERKIIALWAHPRSVSTAFERIFLKRKGIKVFHEPFSGSYYYGPERKSNRYVDKESVQEHSYRNVRDKITSSHKKQIIFFKDMAYYVVDADEVPIKFYKNIINTFIIRNPQDALMSLYEKWPDFTDAEAGYLAQYKLFKRVTNEFRQPAIVIEAEILCEHPGEVIQVYCEQVGIEFSEEYLSWQPGKVKKWGIWKGWHGDAENSMGIRALRKRESTELPLRVQELSSQYQKIYEEMRQLAIEPKCSVKLTSD